MSSHSFASSAAGFDAGALIPPLVQSTTFCLDGIGAGAPHTYSRASNPTVDALEIALGALAAAPPAVAFASGLAAEHALFLALLRQGSEIVVGDVVYGGTTRLLERFFVPFGIRVRSVDASDPKAVAAALSCNTACLFVETPANPTLKLVDLRALAAIARAAGVSFVVDDTFLTGDLRPLDAGATACVLSTTKFCEGHGIAIGGAITSRDDALLERLRFVRKATGAIQKPFDAWLTRNGLETLPLRLARHAATALQVARALEGHPALANVLYPGLPSFPQYALAREQHGSGHGGVVTIELRGGGAAVRALFERVRLAVVAEHVGATRTILTHSATMTHGDVAPDVKRRLGIVDGLVRISVGLEDPAAIVGDLTRALDAIAVLRGEEVARV